MQHCFHGGPALGFRLAWLRMISPVEPASPAPKGRAALVTCLILKELPTPPEVAMDEFGSSTPSAPLTVATVPTTLVI